ncbi:MAG: ATP-dependent helicase HrpB [Ignavibacteriales bacterium]|nr:ATP-dependent helicase HrpB [Ignavibacteriales bacterium]
MEQKAPNFPVEDTLPALIGALASSRCAVLSAPPGAGKTTRVPIALLNAAWLGKSNILMLEPRRLAARRAASFMAQQLGEKVGQTVGYRIRGDAAVGKATRVEVVTEGILTRMLHANPELPGVGLVIFDEFHERSIHADLGLAFTLEVQKHLRDDLRVLVMSATLDGVAIAQLLQGAPIVESAGKMFAVETRYARFASDKPLEIRIADVVARALSSEEGDVLVFLPGMREIRRVEEKLQTHLTDDVVVHLLHGDLSASIQEAALSPAQSGKRKVILSTSIAETSLTIDGVRIVVDSGLARAARFDPRRGMSGLVTIPVSRAVADQRRGRAGRQGAGVCYRLWREEEHQQLPDYPVPEIRVSDLAHAALDLALWGSPTGEGLSFLDPPPTALLSQAQGVLKSLGALTEDGRLTSHGRTMAALPLHPRFAHMIIKGKELKRGAAACELAAILEERDLLGGGAKSDVDLASRIDAFRGGRGLAPVVRDRIEAQRKRLMDMLDIENGPVNDSECGILVSLAYPERVARKRPENGGRYQLANGSVAVLPQGNLGREEFLAIADVDAGSGEAKIYLAASIKESELEAAFSHEVLSSIEIEWSDAKRQVRARRVRKLGAVVLSEQAIEPSGEEITRALLEGIRRVGLSCLPWEKEADRFRTRVQWVRRSMKEAVEWPDLSDEALAVSLEKWLAPFVDGMRKLDQLLRLDLVEILRSMFDHQQLRDLDRFAPSHLQVPSGSRVALDYTPSDHPALFVKLQELFGLTETPRVGGGTTPVTIHLLSPAARPLAVTQDLRSFWQNTYPEIRKQLRAKYPKHPWPEDPLTATPTRRTIRKR